MTEARERWHQLVGQWRSSGETAQEFARRRGVNASTLSHWAWRLERGSRGKATLARVPTMIEVHARPVADDRFEIELNGRRVRVPPSFDVEALRRLLAALEEAP
jgi:transposase-like protein